MNVGKAAGPDDIHECVLRRCAKQLGNVIITLILQVNSEDQVFLGITIKGNLS